MQRSDQQPDEPRRSVLDHLRDDPDLTRLRRAAAGWRSDDRLRRSLVAMLHDDDRLARVADASCVHPNGFAKIVPFGRAESGVRLHLWRSSDRRPDDVVALAHGHRWDFASWIIVGALRETLFEEGASGSPVDHYDYGRTPAGTAYLRGRRTAHLATASRTTWRADDVYTRYGRELHSAKPDGEDLVASLVVQGRRRSGPTSVYTMPGQSPADDDQPVSVPELRILLAEIADVLQPVR